MLVIVAVADAVLGTALGLLASGFARTEFQAVQFMPAFVLPQFLLCGLLVVRDQLPSVLQPISDVLLLSYAVDAMNEVAAESDPLAGIAPELAVIVAWIGASLLLGSLTLRRRTLTGRIALAAVATGAAAVGRIPVDAGDLLRNSLLQLSKSGTVRRTIERAPVSRSVVRRFVPGEATADAVRATAELRMTNRLATIDYLGEDTLDLTQAIRTRDAYLDLLGELRRADLSQMGMGEVSLKLSALGQMLPGDGKKIALEHAREICQAAADAGTTVTLDMEDHTTTDATLRPCGNCARTSRGSAPSSSPTCGAVRPTAGTSPTRAAGSAVQGRLQGAGIRCLPVLRGRGHRLRALPEGPHGRRRLPHGGKPRPPAGRDRRGTRGPSRARPADVRVPDAVRHPPEEQKRIADRGSQMRVYIPYGEEWYGYLMRRMAERPANTLFFLRGLATKG